MISGLFGCASELSTGSDQRGVRAERAAAEARLSEPLPSAGVPVGEHLADQLLVPMAIAHGGRVLTVNPMLHTTTNAEVISHFLPIRFAMSLLDGQRWEIVVRCA